MSSDEQDEEPQCPGGRGEPMPPRRCPHCGQILPAELPRQGGRAYCPNCLLPLSDEHYA